MLRGERVAGDELTQIITVARMQLNSCPGGWESGLIGNVQANSVAIGLDLVMHNK